MINAFIETLTQKQLALLAAFGSFAILAGAFFFQAIGYPPCAMCLWQRWPHAVAIGLGAVFAATKQRLILPLGALLMWASAGLGFFHTGVEKKWWQGPTSCTSAGGDLGSLSGDLLLPGASLDAAIVLCDEVSWSFLGLSMASYNVLGSVAFALIWMLAWEKGRDEA